MPKEILYAYELAFMTGEDPTLRASWFENETVCRAPDPEPIVSCSWDGPGAEDDPVLSWRLGEGAVTAVTWLHLPEPVLSRPYHLGFLAEPFRSFSSLLRTRVYCGGEPVSDTEHVIRLGDSRFRVYGSVVFSDSHDLHVRLDGTTSFPYYVDD